MNIIILGASSGIGLELARCFAKANHTVYITGRRADLLNSLQAEAPDRYKVKVFDVTDPAASERCFHEMISELGKVDVVVVNAGWSTINKSLEWAVERGVLQTNVMGAAHLSVLAMHQFLQQGSGHLVGISSVAALLGNSYNPAYNASKAFFSNYMSGLRKLAKAKRMPIAVTDVRPGYVDTAILGGTRPFWTQPVDKAARQIFAAIQSKRKVVYITKRWSLIGFLLRHFGN
jgi:short-subunit dehydrogenase